MQKIKRFKIALVAMVIFSLVAMYGIVPTVNAGTLDSGKDTVSDSDLSAYVTHTVVFNSHENVVNGKVITVLFNNNFVMTSATGTCPSNSVFASTSNYITCTVNTELSSTTDYTITGINIGNPGTAGYYDVTIEIGDTADPVTPDEDIQMMVYVLSDVTVTASVDATLTFAVSTTSPTDQVNGVNYTGTSSPNAISFGTLLAGQRYVMGHNLAVTTNASDGFIVTVEQDQSLQTAAGADIDSFSTTTEALWSALPVADITDEKTWGQIGVTTEDDGPGFGNGDDEYKGLDGTNKMTVFSHNGPANGSTADAGATKVGYSLQITALQEAGDYENTLTYICTPTY